MSKKGKAKKQEAEGTAAGAAAFDREAVLRMPKVDLHRHLEGALPPEFFMEMAKEFPVPLPDGGREGLERAITMAGEGPDFKRFLAKFDVLRTFYVAPEIIRRAAREAVRLAADENVLYLELRYNPVHFGMQSGYDFEQVIEWVTEGRDEAVSELAIQVELVATINRADSVLDSLPIIQAAIDGAGHGFVGIDIAGDETKGSLTRFAGVLKRVRAAGLGVTIHAGEVGPAANVAEAIRLLGADRIGHGIRVLEDPEVVKLAKEAGIIFEVCPGSNLRTGAVKSMEEHPITGMAHAGLAVTLCADDPVTFGTSLTDEYLMVGNALALDRKDFLELNLIALRGAFRPEQERKDLSRMFEMEFKASA